MDGNREVNPDHNPQDKEQFSEVSKQDLQPVRLADRENPRKPRHKETSMFPTKQQIQKAQKAMESLKKQSDNGTCPGSL